MGLLTGHECFSDYFASLETLSLLLWCYVQLPYGSFRFTLLYCILSCLAVSSWSLLLWTEGKKECIQWGEEFDKNWYKKREDKLNSRCLVWEMNLLLLKENNLVNVYPNMSKIMHWLLIVALISLRQIIVCSRKICEFH